MKTDVEVVTAKISKRDRAQLKRRARRASMTISQYVRELIRDDHNPEREVTVSTPIKRAVEAIRDVIYAGDADMPLALESKMIDVETELETYELDRDARREQRRAELAELEDGEGVEASDEDEEDEEDED